MNTTAIHHLLLRQLLGAAATYIFILSLMRFLFQPCALSNASPYYTSLLAKKAIKGSSTSHSFCCAPLVMLRVCAMLRSSSFLTNPRWRVLLLLCDACCVSVYSSNCNKQVNSHCLLNSVVCKFLCATDTDTHDAWCELQDRTGMRSLTACATAAPTQAPRHPECLLQQCSASLCMFTAVARPETGCETSCSCKPADCKSNRTYYICPHCILLKNPTLTYAVTIIGIQSRTLVL